MPKYSKKLASGHYIVKRGVRYFLCATMDDVQWDDDQEAQNLERLNGAYRRREAAHH